LERGEQNGFSQWHWQARRAHPRRTRIHDLAAGSAGILAGHAH
jgi:hypothetical protein